MALVVIKVWIYSIDSIANNHLGEDNAQNRNVESDEQKIDCQVPHDNQRSWRFPWSRNCLSSEQGRVGRLRETTHKVSFYCFIFIQIAFAFLPFIFFWGSRTFGRIIGTFRIRWSVDMIKSHSPSNRIWSGYKKQQKIRVLSKIKKMQARWRWLWVGANDRCGGEWTPVKMRQRSENLGENFEIYKFEIQMSLLISL